MPGRFKDWTIGGRTGREEHIEELLVRYPGLLNFDVFELSMSSNDEVLIFSRQPAAPKNRADLLGVHRDGNIVVIEIKRDAQDAKQRMETLEFQALRYAAASRKMTASAVVDHFVKYLKEQPDAKKNEDKEDSYWRTRAIELLGEHLAGDDGPLTEEDLDHLIGPTKKQKIYLVAASFEAGATAACAWLREHGIDICAFRLRPYNIAGHTVLERERLIPPPELDEFMGETFAISVQTHDTSTGVGTRKPQNRPKEATWSDEEGSVSVNAWRALLQRVVTRALSEGMSPDQLPMKTSSKDASGMHGGQLINYVNLSTDGQDQPEHTSIYVDLFGNAESIRDMVDNIFQKWEMGATLTVETANGQTYEFPQAS